MEKASQQELHSLYSTSNIVRAIISGRLRWAGHITRMEEGSCAFKILTDKPTGKIFLGRPRYRLEDNIRMDLNDIGVNTTNWIGSDQDRDYF